MARVTVEDCILKVPNRFELVMLASQRARDISAGATETIERDNDKAPVVALREIAEDTLDLDRLQNSLIRGMQKHVIFEDDDEEEDAGLILTSDGEAEVGAPVKAAGSGAAAGAEDGGK